MKRLGPTPATSLVALVALSISYPGHADDPAASQPRAPASTIAHRTADAVKRDAKEISAKVRKAAAKGIEASKEGIHRAADATKRGLDKASAAVGRAADKTKAAISKPSPKVSSSDE